MSYKKDGLGWMEICLMQFYFPAVYNTIYTLIDENGLEAVAIAQKTIEAYNAGMIEKEGN